MIQQVLARFKHVGQSESTEDSLQQDYDLMEAHRRLLNHTTTLQLLEGQDGKKESA